MEFHHCEDNSINNDGEDRWIAGVNLDSPSLADATD